MKTKKKSALEREAESKFIDGCVQQAQNHKAEAIKLFDEVLKLLPNHHAALYNLSTLYYESGNFTTAASLAQKAIKLDPNNRWYYFVAAAALDKSGNTNEAIKVIEAAYKKFNTDLEIAKKLAELYIGKKELNKALRIYNEIEKKRGFYEEIGMQKKEIYLYQQKNDKALEEVLKLKKFYPENQNYQYEHYEILVLMGREKEALSLVERLYNEDPSNVFALYKLVSHYKNKNDDLKANEVLTKAFNDPKVPLDSKISYLEKSIRTAFARNNFTEINKFLAILEKNYGNSAQVFGLKGQIFAIRQNADSARFYFRKALALDELNLNVWHMLLSLDSGGEHQTHDLVNDSEKALEVFPDNVNFLYLNATSNYQLKNYSITKRHLEKILKIGVADKELKLQIQLLLGDTYYYLEEYTKSDAQYLAVLEEQPENTVALNNYAYFLSERGIKLDTALIMIEKVIKLKPDHASYQDTYGWILFKLGRYQEAKSWIEKAYKQSPSSEVCEHLGDIYYKLGDSSQALKFWKEALEKNQNNDKLKQKVISGKL